MPLSRKDDSLPEVDVDDLHLEPMAEILHDESRAGELDGLARQGLELRLACQQIARRVRYEAQAGSVAPHHFAVLARLEEGDLPPSEIAELERVSAPSMTRTVKKLVGEGYVHRTQHPTDRRIVLVGLTDAGQALLDEARHRRDLWMTSRLRQLDEKDIALVPELARILGRVASL
ncbi:MarR family winged helix-turn-helix transcriptional regulator [Austwickia chelonae]|uniref:MarR family winged helix-turn-helix transcriptional regulator n=1 Tax=Austwickia chelonae TaxID=100225 RepID=UPI000E26F40A|nr:MarR family transcriptional regulator [Austwickia chelonae]